MLKLKVELFRRWERGGEQKKASVGKGGV